jgi:hypothetical protein
MGQVGRYLEVASYGESHTWKSNCDQMVEVLLESQLAVSALSQLIAVYCWRS